MRTPSFKKSFRSGVSLIVATTAMIAGPLLQIGALTQYAHAATLTTMSDTMTDQAPSAESTHTIKWTTAGQNVTGDTVIIDFVAADFVPSGTWATTDFALTDIGGGRTATAPVSVGTYLIPGTCSSGATNYIVDVDATSGSFRITFCAGWTASTAANLTTFVIDADALATGGIMTNSASNVESSVVNIAYATSNSDSGMLAIVVESLANVNITATAAVGPTLTFNVSDNTIGFGTLSSVAARYASPDTLGSALSTTVAHTFYVDTNATGGYIVTFKGATLTSGGNTITAIGSSNTASTPGTEQFGLRATVASGSGTVTAPYAAAGFAFTAGTTQPVASYTGVDAGTTFNAIYLANITGATEAGAYSTTLKYIATGTF